LHSALTGKGQMPPQGGGDFSDYEIARAVVYMADKGGAKFPEPAQPAQPSSGATAATTAAATGGTAPTATVPPAQPTTHEAPMADANAAPSSATGTTVAAAAAAAPTTTGAGGGAAPALYEQICSTCHAAGIAGAPKLGDKAAWAPRVAQGIDALTASAIHGKGAMPPKGGSSASDAEIKGVVSYMVGASK
jgi:cytochrome c5